jgi:hypothetical protein
VGRVDAPQAANRPPPNARASPNATSVSKTCCTSCRFAPLNTFVASPASIGPSACASIAFTAWNRSGNFLGHPADAATTAAGTIPISSCTAFRPTAARGA